MEPNEGDHSDDCNHCDQDMESSQGEYQGDDQCVQDDEEKKQTKRERVKLNRLGKLRRKGDILYVGANQHWVSLREKGETCITQAGVREKTHCPITYKHWKRVSKANKNRIWVDLKSMQVLDKLEVKIAKISYV